MSYLYKHSDNNLEFTVTKQEDGSVFENASMSAATWELLAPYEDTVLLSKSIGDGVTLNNDKVYVKLDDSEMTFNTGLYRHRLVIYNLAGDKLPPAVFEQIEMK